jgi:hypothetical protein
MQVDIDKAIEIEEKLFGNCFENSEQMKNFLEKGKKIKNLMKKRKIYKKHIKNKNNKIMKCQKENYFQLIHLKI